MTGNLSEFTMAELLQLFALAERTGTMLVTTPRGSARVLLESGRVVGIGHEDFNVYDEIMACELMPARSGASLDAVSPTPQTPGLSFIVRNLVEPQRWDLFVRRCIEQQIYPFLNAEQGSFEVTVERLPYSPLATSLSVQQLILDGSRWEAEIREHRQDGFPIRARFRRNAPPNGDTRITTVEWLLWTVFEEAASIGEVARRVGIPDLDATVTVRKMLADGWLHRDDG